MSDTGIDPTRESKWDVFLKKSPSSDVADTSIVPTRESNWDVFLKKSPSSDIADTSVDGTRESNWGVFTKKSPSSDMVVTRIDPTRESNWDAFLKKSPSSDIADTSVDGTRESNWGVFSKKSPSSDMTVTRIDPTRESNWDVFLKKSPSSDITDTSVDGTRESNWGVFSKKSPSSDMAVTRIDPTRESNWGVFMKKSWSSDSADISVDATRESNWDVFLKKSPSSDMADTVIDPTQESSWDVVLKKSVDTGPDSWGSSATNSTTWNHAERVGTQGCGANGGKGTSPQRYSAQAIDSQASDDRGSGYDSKSDTIPYESDGVSKSSDVDEESADDPDDDLSDYYDSDAGQQSHELRKKNRWFRVFFVIMDSRTIEEINEQTRRWQCPACRGGSGAIAWYYGLQPLLAHAKTKRSSRVKLHRQFAELLEEELQRRGTEVVPAGKPFSRWKGMHESTTDLEIVWPPMVVILNTVLKKADSKECLGISSQELREYFKEYAVAKVCHSYGPDGHRGMSALIFEASAMGYWEAEHLHKHFVASGRGRDAWEQCPMKFDPCAGCQLYGFLALKEDMDSFTQYLEGRIRLKFEMRSYQKTVAIPMRQMRKDNLTLRRLKQELIKQEQELKLHQEALGLVSQKLRQKTEEGRTAGLIAKTDSKEQFFKAQIDPVKANSGTTDAREQREKERTGGAKSLVSREEDFEEEKERRIAAYEAKKAKLEQKHQAERRELEEEFATDFAEFVENHVLLNGFLIE